MDCQFDWDDRRPDSELTREEIIERNIAAVLVHFHNENPETVETAVAVYTDDIVWEIPARGILLRNREDILAQYRDLFKAVVYEEVFHLRRFATEDYVLDDQVIHLTKVADLIPNHDFPVGSKLSVRLVHCFEMRDGRIKREIAYELWRERGGKHDLDDLENAEIENFPPIAAGVS